MEPNHRLRAAREACPSPSAPGEAMSRGELAEAVNDHLWSATGKRYALDAHTIARYERGTVRWPSAAYRAGLRAVLGVGSDAELGFRPTRRGGQVRLTASHRVPQPEQADGRALSGIWRSRYVYYSDSRQARLEDEHFLVLHQEGARLQGRSVADASGSELGLDLTVAGMVVNGYWWERTSPAGYYGGATYHGTLQLLLAPTSRGLVGKWVGFGKDLDVNTGAWELAWVGPSTVSAGADPARVSAAGGRRLSR